MAVRMAALNSSAAGETIARKVIPKDVREEYRRLYGVGREAILKVPAGTSKAQAEALHGQWLAEVETRIERIRASARGEGQPLTKLNALAWQVLSPHAPEERHGERADPSWPWVNRPEVRAAKRSAVTVDAV